MVDLAEAMRDKRLASARSALIRRSLEIKAQLIEAPTSDLGVRSIIGGDCHAEVRFKPWRTTSLLRPWNFKSRWQVLPNE